MALKNFSSKRQGHLTFSWVLWLAIIKEFSQLIQATFELFDGHASQLCFHKCLTFFLQ